MEPVMFRNDPLSASFSSHTRPYPLPWAHQASFQPRVSGFSSQDPTPPISVLCKPCHPSALQGNAQKALPES